MVVIGGVVFRENIVAACRSQVDGELLVSDFPSHVVAFGAAILELQRYAKRSSPTAVATG